MSNSSAFKTWLEKTLEKPFFEAEMARAEMTRAQPGEESMTPVMLLAVYAVGFAAFCSYWMFFILSSSY